ncbi:MAG: hypothetical protein BGN85_12230 [Alphaproteobacteria bacterium 64-11]|nr:hypothetical protein [Alphaproteobacteria bacterium]OJU08283.1 MAG: hypothetical protein BGN85_12230 [Alphaproteobacteria bacterium 64-11]
MSVSPQGITAYKFENVLIVGIEREAKILNLKLDQYMRKIEDGIRNSALGEPLKTQVLTNLDVISYKGLQVVRVRIPKQGHPSFVGDDCFVRSGSSTMKATGPQIAAVTGLFK